MVRVLLLLCLTLPLWSQTGQTAYVAQCGNCHGPDLNGGNEAPPLSGDRFLAKWKSRPASALLDNIRTTMPADRPGTLTASQAAEITAYIRSVNHLPVADPAPADDRAAPIVPAKIEGRPIETLPTEMPGNKPAFPQQTRAPYHRTPPYKITVLADKMPAPWGLDFLPNGNIILTHRLPGSLHILAKNGTLSPLKGLPEALGKSFGLLEVALDPRYPTNHRIFLTFFDYIDGTNSNTNIARATLDEANLALTDLQVIFRGIPAIPTKRLGGKTGGRIVFAPDGTLFVSTGDRSDSPPWTVAQQLDNHLGKILHITAEGKPAPNNPFLNTKGALPEIWAYGIRNAEGLAADPTTDRLWEHEHGPRGGDELNIIERGKNYGWPTIVHGIDYPGTVIGEGITHKPGLEEPIYYWDPVIAPSGLAFYKGNLFPQWKGSLFVGGLRSKTLNRLKIVNDKVVEEEALLDDLHERIRDVKVGPDGALYVLTDSGTSGIQPTSPLTSKLLKLTPQ